MLIVIYIMNNDYYKDWKKYKIVCFEDFLVIKVDEEIEFFVYIDNIFDGYIYCENVWYWWYFFCYFYFWYVKKFKDIYFLIIVKEDVVEEVLEYINVDIFLIDNISFV